MGACVYTLVYMCGHILCIVHTHTYIYSIYVCIVHEYKYITSKYVYTCTHTHTHTGLNELLNVITFSKNLQITKEKGTK